MGIKKSIVKFGLIPKGKRWSEAVWAVGGFTQSLWNFLASSYEEKELLDILKKAAYQFGRDDVAPRIREELGLVKSMDDAVLSCTVVHKIFGIKSKIVEKTDDKVVFKVNYCPWADFLDPKVCDIFSEVEVGTVEGIDPDYEHSGYTKMLTKGEPCCEFRIKRKD